MLPSLKVVCALFFLLHLISSKSVIRTHLQKQMLSEIIHQIEQLNSRVQVPCNDTRVAQLTFRNPKDQELLLCQAAKALSRVHRCKDYEPLVTNLRSLSAERECRLSSDNEIYLRHFLPELGNFTQAMFRRREGAPQ